MHTHRGTRARLGTLAGSELAPYRLAGTFGELAFWPGGLTLLAAAPGVGKTSWLLRMVAEAAAAGLPAVIGCYEHTPQELAFRLRMQAAALVAGPHGEPPAGALERALSRWNDALLLELSDREETTRVLEDLLLEDYGFPRQGPALVAVDYLQRVPVVGIGGLVPEALRAGEAAAALRALSRRRGWAIVAASATRADTFAQTEAGLSALLGDERVVYEADRVLWAAREEEAPCGCARWQVRVLKDRTAPPASFPMIFWGERFYPRRGRDWHEERAP